MLQMPPAAWPLPLGIHAIIANPTPMPENSEILGPRALSGCRDPPEPTRGWQSPTTWEKALD